MQILFPELTLLNGTPTPNCAVQIDDSGTIEKITREAASEGTGEGHLPGQFLIPGMVNGHSHAFQRAIRGRTHWRPAGHSDFWSWRETMYGVVAGINPGALYAISFQAFKEMLEAGYTHVGEFHYVHHGPNGDRYEDRNELANTVIQAAVDAGILITLLRVVYLETGFESVQPSSGQLRFMDANVAESIQSIDELMLKWNNHPGVQIGVAPHSVRAVHQDALRTIADWANNQDIPIHLHASEQVAEIEQTLKATGMRPVELIHSTGLLGRQTTLVHGTHLSEDEQILIEQSGCSVCVCPSTEADLGDGLFELTPMLRRGVPLTLGSDSQAIIDPFHEMRALDMHERLRIRGRTPTTLEGGIPGTQLMQMSTVNGLKSLGWSGGEIAAGNAANFCSLNLTHPALVGLDPQNLLAGVSLHGDRTMVTHTWVQGEKKVSHGLHPQTSRSLETYETTLASLFSG